MKKNWAKTYIAILLALLFAITSACSGAPEAEAVASPTPEALLATPEPVIQPGGTLRLPMPVNADESDPLKVNTEEMLALYSLVFESLLSIDSSGQLVPELAENWSADETGRVWTLRLRSSARWHDTGAGVTAADVIQTFDKIKSSADGGYYSYVTNRIESMETGEDGALVITMKQPGYASLYALTFPVTESALTATGNYPAGTGPYKFAYVSDERVRLERNPNWWKDAPYIDGFEFYARNSNDISLASFTAGQLDMVMTSSLSVGRYRNEGNASIIDVMTQTCEVMLLNYSNQYLRDLNIRQALAYALDRSDIITNVYMNRARECDVPVPPDSWLYESKSKIYDYNPEVALGLLAESGWSDTDGDGFLEKDGNRYDEMTLTLLVNESTDKARETAAAQIKAQLEELGIHIELVSAAYALGDSESEYLSKLSSGEFDLALAGFNLARDCDLTSYLALGGNRNYGGYSNAAIEKIAQNIVSAIDTSEYRAAANELQMRFIEELPFITLYFRLNSILYRGGISGLEDTREPDVMRNVASWHLNEVD